MRCHPDRSAAQWRDLLFISLAPLVQVKQNKASVGYRSGRRAILLIGLTRFRCYIKAAGTQGTVVLLATIDTNGKVVSIPRYTDQ